MIKNKLIVALTVSLVVAGSKAYAAPNVKRIYGQDRYETSSKVCDEGWSSSYYAVIVCGENFPDALSAITLAKKYNAPVLLTNSKYLNYNTEKQLERLGVKKAFIIGGSGTVSLYQENHIKNMGIDTERLGGRDRYETSIKVAEKIGNTANLFLVTGESYMDALSISPIAAKKGNPIILVPKNYTPDCVKKFISDKKFTKVFVVGSEDVISDNVSRNFENCVEMYDRDVERICGDRPLNNDTYKRNVNIIDKFQQELNLDKNIYVASGRDFADSLSIGPLAAKNQAPVVMVNPKDNNFLKSFISKKYDDIDSVNVVGGQGVLPEKDVNSIFNYLEDEEVVFQDEKLENAVKDKLHIINKNKKIFKSDVSSVTSLDLTGYGITDISGIKYFKNLKELNLSKNNIEDIEELKELSYLKRLNLSNNRIDDIEDLKEIYNLKQLNLCSNKINDMDDVVEIKNLENLNMADNDISSIPSDIDKLWNLNYLDLSRNSSLRSFSNLDELFSLKVLRLSDCSIHSISKLKNLTNLIELDLAENSISNLDDLTCLTNLKVLYLNDNNVSDVEPLKELKFLEKVNLWKNTVDDVKDLEKIENLKEVTLQKDKLDEEEEDKVDYLDIPQVYTKNTYTNDYASNNDYYNDIDINDNDRGQTGYMDDKLLKLKKKLVTFENLYNTNYDEKKVIYHSYNDSNYSKNAKTLLEKEKNLISYVENEDIDANVRTMINKDLMKVIDRYFVVDKNHRMNEEIKKLEFEMKTTFSQNDKRKLRNKINYVYSNYRLDFYKNAIYMCEEEMKNIDDEMFNEDSYSNSERNNYLNGEKRNKEKEYFIFRKNYNKYLRDRKFYSVVDSLFE